LSGQDYPIKGRKYIIDCLEQQYPKPLIDVDEYKSDNWVGTKFRLIRWIQKVDYMHEKYSPGIARKIRVAPYVIAENFEKHFYGTPYDRLKKYGISLYGGSAWWILPHDVISFINEVRANKPKLIKDFQRTWTPEETFFQTMVMASPLARCILKNDEIYESSDQACMTYANFVTPKRPFCGHPHIILTEDFERITHKKSLFARKFDIFTDSYVLDMIDEMTGNR
jgi:hypothetical protein